jgi:hypothetical protein
MVSALEYVDTRMGQRDPRGDAYWAVILEGVMLALQQVGTELKAEGIRVDDAGLRALADSVDSHDKRIGIELAGEALR